MKTVVAIIIGVLLLAITLKFYKVMTPSMSDEIEPGDIVLSHKLYWPFRVKHSDIVAFNNNMVGDETTYIKRVVGTPGDTIWIKPHFITLKGKEIPHDSIFEMMDPETNSADSIHFLRSKMYTEYLFSRHKDVESSSQFILDSLQAFIIPDGYFLMIGDNYYESMDSRFWGFIPRENIKGKVIHIF